MVRLGIVALGLVLAAGSAFAQCPASSSYPRLCYLADASFNPEAKTPAYRSPLDACSEPFPRHAAEIKSAFDCASPYIKQHLLDLSAIFVLPNPYAPTSGQSFGMWENTSDQIAPDGSTGRSYIFLSQNVFFRTLSDLESTVQNDVLAAYGKPRSIRYEADPDTSAIGLLSVMAHEVAHARWYSRKIGNNAQRTCFDQDFLTLWKNRRIPNRRWVAFADPAASDHSSAAQTKHPKDASNDDDLRKLYGPFASVFAAVSPEEDFVETYKLIAIAPARLNVFRMITSGNVERDVKRLMTQGRLRNKVACVLGLA